MTYSFIVNPKAGRKHPRERVQKVRSLMDEFHVKGTVIEAATEEAIIHAGREMAQRSDVVIAAGGDGTVQAVVNGLFMAKKRAVLGVLPQGTGNDFARVLGIPASPRAAFSLLTEGAMKHVDIGAVTWEEHGVTKKRLFVNAVGFGVEAAIAARVQKRKSAAGWLVYGQALLHVLRNWQHPVIRTEAGSSRGALDHLFSGDVLACTVGNGHSSGGGFPLTPSASITDGLLNSLVVPALSKTRLARILPWVPLGLHDAFPEVAMHTASVFRVSSDKPLLVHADGEIITRIATWMEVQVLSQVLPVICRIDE